MHTISVLLTSNRYFSAHDDMAREAYEIADAMLKARELKKDSRQPNVEPI